MTLKDENGLDCKKQSVKTINNDFETSNSVHLNSLVANSDVQGGCLFLKIPKSSTKPSKYEETIIYVLKMLNMREEQNTILVFTEQKAHRKMLTQLQDL